MRKLRRRTYSVACAVGHHMRAHRMIARTLVTTAPHRVNAVPLHPPVRKRNHCCALCLIVSANKYKWPPRDLLACWILPSREAPVLPYQASIFFRAILTVTRHPRRSLPPIPQHQHCIRAAGPHLIPPAAGNLILTFRVSPRW